MSEFPEQEEVERNKSSVKVTHNSKGYNWEVKVYDDDPDKALETTIRLEKKCEQEYGIKA